MANDEYSYYYHHTDKESAIKILQSGYIKQSEGKQGDAVFGDGTYLTRVGPNASESKVARNNYDGIWEDKIGEGKTDVAIKVKLQKAEVQQCDVEYRDIHLYKGDLKLSDAKQVDLFVRKKGGVKKISNITV